VRAKRLAAICVHLLTASGSICGLFALYFAARQDWQMTFFSLGLAAFIDGIDGPLARRLDITKILPRFSGATLDETVDFLNYCIIPAFILVESGIFRPWLGLFMASLVVLTSLFHFADKKSKTTDGYFVGFPVAWNFVCFYFFVFGIEERLATVVILIFTGLTFLPLKWTHPLRVQQLRPVTLLVVACWCIAAIVAISDAFPSGPFIRIVFGFTAIYLLSLGIVRSLRGREKF
jgi:phosphatidylcholine synthase